MNSRRLTIFCVALVALAGTPRAWQEAGKLLAAVQHKAQVKFWSMVLQPKNRESAGVELVASALPVASTPETLESDCPLATAAPHSLQAKSNSKAGRKADFPALRPQRRTEPQSEAVAPLSHTGLIAKALKAPRGDKNAESLRHSRSLPLESRLSGFAESRSSLLAADSRARGSASKADTFKFVMLPTVNPVASALVEKENVVRLKMLRKSMEEPKAFRQKTRLPAIRGASSYFPAS